LETRRNMRKILLVTDAWKPQTNGVVTTLTNLVDQAKRNGDTIHVFHPGRCKIRFPMPGYKEITLGIPMPWTVRKLLNKRKWDHIHIATPEGPIGIAFARTCRRLGIPFSTSCHTKFAEFVHARVPLIPVDFGWKWMRHVYRDSTHILTTTDSMVQELKDRGFTQNIKSWTRGVDRNIFNAVNKQTNTQWPLLVCVSRVSHEKGLDDFCQIELDIPCTKVVVGDGPYRRELEKKYSDVKFVGLKKGQELAKFYQNADVFVFPSKADTFGVVIIESLACGTPVAAYPVTGPIDIITPNVNGCMSDNLADAVNKCLTLDRKAVEQSSLDYTWENCYKQFVEILLPAK
jgi:glycosyltransferase involved in cell wall biosynthesis